MTATNSRCPAPQSRQIEQFRAEVLRHYREHARDLPWRETRDAYAILISEVMLQQTQVIRVVPKYLAFIRRFPTFATLAEASPAHVLSEWQGLGYNRRALALRRTAAIVHSTHDGVLPRTLRELERLPGIGRATAAAICTYAYNIPVAFIETNVRAAFIHFFFQESTSVSDADLLPLVEAALDCDDPRHWYYALMDYGAWIKRNHANPARRSKHHVAQSAFAGSRRQARAAALRILLAVSPSGLPLEEIRQTEVVLARHNHDDVLSILRELCAEGFLACEDGKFRVA